MSPNNQTMIVVPNSGSPTGRDVVEAWYAGSDPVLLDPAIDCLALGYHTSRSRYLGAAAMIEDFFVEVGSKYKKWSVEAEKIIDAGSYVTVIGNYKALCDDDVILNFPFVHVWSVNDGKLKSVICCTDVKYRKIG